MLTPFGSSARRLASWLLVALLPGCLFGAGVWRPLTKADHTIESTGLDTSAGAIILLREISVDDSDLGGTEVDYYIRVKVLSAKGVEALNKTELPFNRDNSIRGLAARVVKADGTEIEVDKKAFYTREVIKAGGQSISVKAFSFAGLEPGCIAEYQYRMRSDDALGGMRLNIDDTFPVSQFRIRIRPFQYPGLGIKMIWSRDANIVNKGRDRRNFYIFEGTNIGVVPEEPLMPPDEITHPWFAFYFTFNEHEKYWNYMAGELAAGGRTLLKPTKAITQAAERITAGATTTEEKIRRLYDFCRTEIKNLSYDTSGYTPDEIADLKPAIKPNDVLKLGYGTSSQINMLFAAMLRALKAECSLVYCGDRSKSFFNETITMRSTLPDLIVALKAGSWRFYDPGALYLPPGQLHWTNEGTTAMVIDGKYFEFISTAPSEADYSTIRRDARLKLDEHGRLEGDLEITYSGHAAWTTKHRHDNLTEQESLELIRDTWTKRLGKVELTDVVIHDARDPDKPVKITCRMRAEDYAETTAGRMFLQPAVFQKGLDPQLPAATRKFDIYFSYPTTEEDTVTIELPEGFEREAPGLPKALPNEEALTYHPRIRYAGTPETLTYQRSLVTNLVLVRQRAYPWLKESFDHIHRQDAYTITLKRVNQPAPSAASVTADAPGGDS